MADRLRLWWHRWPRTLLRLALPSHCALCGGPCAGVVCPPCEAACLTPGRARCPCCANPLPPPVLAPARCGACLAAPPAFDATVAAADYAAPLDGLVLQLKFGARLALAPWCAGLLRDAVLAQAALPLPELLCVVPLGTQRLAERGFNQSLEIARPLAAALGIALLPQLARRRRDTAAQSGMAPGARRANIRGAFAVAQTLAGQHVGVVDDVMSSGSTLHELAGTLKRAGAGRVTNLVFARTPPH